MGRGWEVGLGGAGLDRVGVSHLSHFCHPLDEHGEEPPERALERALSPPQMLRLHNPDDLEQDAPTWCASQGQGQSEDQGHMRSGQVKPGSGTRLGVYNRRLVYEDV